MIDLYYWSTPNGWKITLMLEECGLPYRILPVDIGAGDQFTPDFLKISPNNKIPAIIDHEPGQAPLSLFESGAILVYLAEKTGFFLPKDDRARMSVLQWLFWQVSGLGPMAGQSGHFRALTAENIPYAIERYGKEYHRLLSVMNRHLETRSYLAGGYSIADIACWPWVHVSDRLGVTLSNFPHLNRWHQAIAARPAAQKAIAPHPAA